MTRNGITVSETVTCVSGSEGEATAFLHIPTVIVYVSYR